MFSFDEGKGNKQVLQNSDEISLANPDSKGT